jgi:hypothetical protein
MVIMEQTNDFPHWYIIEGELPRRCRIILNPNDKEDREYWIIATEEAPEGDVPIPTHNSKCSSSFSVCKKFGEDAVRTDIDYLRYQINQAERQLGIRRRYLSDLLNMSVDNNNNLVVREVPIAKFKMYVYYGTDSAMVFTVGSSIDPSKEGRTR